MIKRVTIAGVMTGTSCDGVDIASVEFDSESWSPKWEASRPYPKKIRDRVFAIQKVGARLSLDEIFSLDADIGTWLGKTLTEIIEGLTAKERPEIIAMHGQTVAHAPLRKPTAYTVQLGEPTVVAEMTGRTVISGFRQGDIAAGGEGAPLVPIYHYLLSSVLPGSEKGVALHNLGGISNFTYIKPDGSVFGVDTGPANVWIDAAVERISKGKKTFDAGGKIALSGRVDLPALKALLRHPYLKRPAPKSTGRDEFPPEYFFARAKKLTGEDLVATATAYTVETIVQAYEKFVIGNGNPLSAIYLCGGGAKNDTIRLWLADLLPNISVLRIEDVGFDSQFIEAQAFAFLGYRSLLGLPVGGPWTGAEKFGPPGKITPGKNWAEILKRLP
ncbi:MAG: anhydro-N-acetylmuramic acid kinase [Cryobacterium sp.]|nr:anhydro-N-acetylmuramic acid kinase [Oligoflexia bacterium]